VNRRLQQFSSLSLVSLFVLAAVALLLVSAPSAEAQGFGKNKVQYRDFEWKIYHSPHFDVYYYEDEKHLLQKVVSFAESAYDQLSRDFNYRIQEPTPLIFYETHSAFEQNNIILNFIPEGIGAFASPVRNRMVLPVDLPDPELMQLLLHELTHIFEYHILFQGSVGKGVASSPPTWFMEGLASYMAKDESARDKMYLRDAVVNDLIPPVTSAGGIQGFFAYRFGFAVFEFIEERWGKDGLNDFIIETRNTLGARVGRAVERTFQMSPEDFDGEFRRWLRAQYLPELVATGEPADFGRPFRVREAPRSQQTSPVASPSGDLLASFSTQRGDVDVVLFDAKNRAFLKNLTKGYSNDFQYLVAQEMTLGRKMGRDLAFSPDGNAVAFFARRGRGRVLVILNVLKGRIDKVIEMEVEQQIAPAWHPDGRSVAFAGHRGGRFDIFSVDIASEEVTHITNDEIFDGSPAYSPDGQTMVLTSVVGGKGHLFQIDLDNPGLRDQLTFGDSEDTDAVFSPDGARVFFTSDRTGTNNIYSLELATKVLWQHTNSVTGCFMPTVLTSDDGSDRLVFTAFWKGRFQLYLLDTEEPITEAIEIANAEILDDEPRFSDDLPRFEPAIEVAVDESDTEKYGGKKFFLENASGGIGISDDQTFIAQSVVSFSDYLGDRRIIASFQSIESFQNFDVIYANLANRLQWQVHLFDDRDFFTAIDQRTGFRERTNSAFSQTGAIASLIYPINIGHRVELGAGYIFRELDFFSSVNIPVTDLSNDQLRELYPQIFPPGTTDEAIEALLPFAFPSGEAPVLIASPREDDYPIVQASLIGDTAIFAPWGGIKGRRWRVGASYAPDTSESGTLTSSYNVDFRQYIPISRRSNLAFRAVGVVSDGNFPSPFYFGGLDTVRGFDFRSIIGDRGFYANLEYRFPLIDNISTPFLRIDGIRGVVFVDVGGAWFDEFQDFDFYDSDENRLVDGVSSYGWGITARIFGIDANFDFAKRWNFDSSADGFESSFWIGRRF